LKDGERFDLGNGEALKVMFTPGHQPSGFVVFEQKNKGVFINDLAGLYLADTESSWVFTPYNSDVVRARESLRKLVDLSIDRLYLGHFGIFEEPRQIIIGAIEKIGKLLAVAEKCVKEGKKEQIAATVISTILAPELEKVRVTRGGGFYDYLKNELAESMSAAFASYYLQHVQT